MRQMVLECGYSAASVRERIYALAPEAEDGPMAGILIYTSAPDSEGTLGGLVNLGYPDTLGRHIEAALERGNHFLDRSLLIETIIPQGRAFFAPQG